MTEGKGRLTNRLYSESLRVLREHHLDEFHAILELKYAEHGLTYKRRLTADERAERDRLAEIEKARVASKNAEARLASLLGEQVAMELTGTAEAEVIPGSQALPYGGAHPVDPEALAEFEKKIPS